MPDDDRDMNPYPRLAPPFDQPGPRPPSGDQGAVPAEAGSEPQSFLLELSAEPGDSPVSISSEARKLTHLGFVIDEEFEVVPMDAGQSYIVRGTVGSDESMKALEESPRVRRIWRDTPVAPF